MKAASALHPMTAKELAKIIINHENLTILDVRNTNDFDDWKIEGANIEIINIPYFDLLEGVEPVRKHLQDDKKVLVVCAKEGSSLFVAEQLIKAGYPDVFYLEGGMKSWSEHLEPVKIGDLTDGGAIYQFVRIGKGCLSYMVISGGEAAVVDTPRMTDVFETFAKAHGARITHTIDTHLHADHISGGKKLAEKSKASYWIPPKDAEEISFEYEKLEDGNDITVGNTTIRMTPIYSPGHTIGSTSLIVDDQFLLTGDILFIASIGRPDLAGKAEDWAGDLRHTLFSRYKELKQDLTVLPAHFGKITELDMDGKVSARLAELYEKNPGLTVAGEIEFRRSVTEKLPPQPHAYLEIRQANRGKIQPSEEEQREMEIGPNRCAVHDN
ncbi:MBL fold metallo-hydrolase [Paenibacillus sp. LPE1-1-1.1]|uniref:MBL fold metallo-hydrolase n=1 Tax=Paenibacillus sp. LPE1-1-1.1 TaxID=3135230 RepID=UPI0034242A9F